MDIQRDHVLHSENGRFTPTTSSQRPDVARILDLAANAEPAGGLVLHFHGGLVDQTKGHMIAERLSPGYAAAGAYPLFFIWESGPLETIANNLPEIPRDKAFQELIKKVAEWALKKSGGSEGGGGKGLRGGPERFIDEVRLRQAFDAWFAGTSTNLPVADECPADGQIAVRRGMRGTGADAEDLAYEIASGLDTDPSFQEAIRALRKADATVLAAGEPRRVLMDEQACDRLFPGRTPGRRGGVEWVMVARFIAPIVIAVLRRFASGRAHGFYCTVVEEVLRAAYLDRIGAMLWNRMKQDTRDSFAAHSNACGSAVVAELHRLRGQHRLFQRLTLIGHSTGAIFICEFLDALAAAMPDLTRDELSVDLVFLAPAVTHERFAAALSAHRARIGHFRMFAMQDVLEREDHMVPILYPRSLLYFVSGVLEGHTEGPRWVSAPDTPVVGMDRYLTDSDTYATHAFPAVASVRRFFAALTNGKVLSEANHGHGCRSMSHRHGDFDNDGPTLQSLHWILSNGF